MGSRVSQAPARLLHEGAYSACHDREAMSSSRGERLIPKHALLVRPACESLQRLVVRSACCRQGDGAVGQLRNRGL